MAWRRAAAVTSAEAPEPGAAWRLTAALCLKHGARLAVWDGMTEAATPRALREAAHALLDRLLARLEERLAADA